MSSKILATALAVSNILCIIAVLFLFDRNRECALIRAELKACIAGLAVFELEQLRRYERDTNEFRMDAIEFNMRERGTIRSFLEAFEKTVP